MKDRPEMARLRCSVCGGEWVGMDRAHCRLCCQTFDDAALFDVHREADICVRGGELHLRQTKNGIWVRALLTSSPR